MTAPTSKLGAEMTDIIKYFLEAWEMNGVGQTVATVQDSPGTVVSITVDDLRALLARQPAAIDKQEIRNLLWQHVPASNWVEASEELDRLYAAPLANEASKPAPSTSHAISVDPDAPSLLLDAAPSVEQDERGAFEAWYRKEILDATMYRRDFKGSDRYGEYCQWFQEEAWKAWQARAAYPQASQPNAEAIRRAALKEAAKVCDMHSDDFNRRRKTSDNPTYMEGKSDGAEACASALLRLAAQPASEAKGETNG
ncbi:hypothetical protein [Paraburkholderia atlantica]|uniref:hypothetical protein n=1 Tax=Paraburkholderia atlantica TaxID=2654982 RepID=UPI0016078EC4|nr:hypothetical protein [Paraburkholderia atlantica]MBB5508099.1 hypothetical protein [Paraburkholderia atlantica]